MGPAGTVPVMEDNPTPEEMRQLLDDWHAEVVPDHQWCAFHWELVPRGDESCVRGGDCLLQDLYRFKEES